MNDYVDQNMSLLFDGFQDNVLMRMTPNSQQEEITKSSVGDPNPYASLQDELDEAEEMETTRFNIVNADPFEDDLDETLHDVDMLEFIQQYFVDDFED